MRLYRFAPLATLALCIPLVTGCSGITTVVMGEDAEFHCPRSTAPGLAIAVGARANSPTPALPAEARKLVVSSMKGCGRITVVRVDGRPSVVRSLLFSTGAKTQQNLDSAEANFLKSVDSLIGSARASTPEVNDLQALSVASGAAGSGGTVVLVDSGIQTTGPLDFRKDALPSRRPTAVVDALRKQSLLPHLAGRSVILAGLGYTAAPQDALDDKSQTFVTNLWRQIVVASGAKDPVVVDDDPNTSGSVTRTPSVSTVKFPAATISLSCNTMSVLPDSGEVGFVPDQAEFRNPAPARTVLRRFADFLRDNPTAHVDIKGYVAHYGNGDDLSRRRAERVKQELSQWARNPIAAEGMGWGPYPSPKAPPGKRYDQLNRQVTIEVICP